MQSEKQTYNQLITEIGSLLQQGRQQAVQYVGNFLIRLFFIKFPKIQTMSGQLTGSH
jgi:hypothetical protein